VTAPADDAELLERSAAGDRSAFTELMDRHAEAVYRLLLSLGASREDAEDALQDCFLSAWRSAGSFRGGHAARAWLLAIARNALRRQHRRRAGEPTELESLEALGAGAGWGVESDFRHRFEVRDELEWALGQIPPEERQVVTLRDLEGFSGEEAAEALELSVSAMKSRLHRGRLRLMQLVRMEDENA
jgi:RNA polymerase sigma-70 factor (ECF subfamily)